MSKLTRALVVGATLAAMNLAGMTAVAQAQPPDGVEQFRRGERASQEQSTTAEAVEEFRRGERVASPEQTTADAALRRVLARERFSIPSGTPEQPTAPSPPEPSAQPNWLLASLGGFAAGLALAGGLAVLAARRAGRSARIQHAA